PNLRHLSAHAEGKSRPPVVNALPSPQRGAPLYSPPPARGVVRPEIHNRRGPRGGPAGGPPQQAAAPARAGGAPRGPPPRGRAAAATGGAAAPSLLSGLLRPHARAPLGDLAQRAALPGRAAPDAVVGTCGDRSATAAPPPAASSSRLRARRVLARVSPRSRHGAGRHPLACGSPAPPRDDEGAPARKPLLRSPRRQLRQTP